MKEIITATAKHSVVLTMLLVLVFSPFMQLVSVAQAASVQGPTQTGATLDTVVNTNNNNQYDTPECSWTSNWSLCLTNVVYAFTVGIGSSFAYVAAQFFNLAVNLSLNGPVYALTFVSTGWTTARDLANMAFLFILIYIAFIIMFQAETSGTMSLLAGVVVIALLVNFSFFFTRLVIDAGNILSIQFYNSIQAPSIQSTAKNSNVASTVNTAASSILGAQTQTKDLTSSIMGMLQLQNLFNTNSFQNFYKPTDGSAPPGFMTVVITLSFLYIGAAIMFYLLTVVFITAGIKFLVRIVVLWFLIIFSPLAFVSHAIPNFKKYFDKWRDMLIAHAFYPVAFMFVFLILTNFANQMGSCTTNGATSSQNCLINDIFTSLPTAANAGSMSAAALMALAFANVAIRLGFVIAILYMGLKLADGVSVVGASFAQKAGNWVGGKFKASTLGLASRAGGVAFRETIGRQAQNDIDSLKKNPPKNIVGQYMDFAWRKSVLAPLANTSIGGAKSYTGIAASRKEVREDWNKNKDEALTNIKNREDAKKLAEIDTQWDPLAKQLAPLEERVKEIESTHGPLPLAVSTELSDKKAQIAKLKPEMDKIRPQREQLISNMEKAEGTQVTALAGKDIENIIKHISDKQLKAIQDSLKYSKTEKETLERKWNESSQKAPLAESKAQLKKLEEIHAELRKIGFDPTTKLPKLNEFVKPALGTTVNINLASAKMMKKELEDQQAEQEDTRDNPGKTAAARQLARKAVRQLKEAVGKVTKLEEQVKNIPKDVGGTGNEGEFKVEGK